MTKDPALPELSTVPEFVAHYAASRPAAPALSAEGDQLTYAQTYEATQDYAQALLRAGIRPGDVVGVFGNSRPECLLVFLACCRTGAVYLGLNPKYTARELEYICRDARPQLLFVMSEGKEPTQPEHLHAALQRIGTVRTVIARRALWKGRLRETRYTPLEEFLGPDWLGQPPADTPISQGTAADPDAPCAIVYTSGSTGSPKGALLSQQGMVRSAILSWRYWYGADVRLRTVAQHPINHVGWLVCECVATLVAGGTLFFREHFDGGATLRLIEQERLTLWIAIPSMIMLAAESPEFRTCDLSSLRRIAFGMPPTIELMQRLRSRTDAVFCVSYGLTEAHGGAVIATEEQAGLATVAATMGRAVPGINVRVAEPDGREAELGEVGELLIRDRSVFLGYLNQPAATAEALQDGWLHTGDLARQDSTRQYIFVGRKKEMFKSGGYNVYPSEVENVICRHPDVSLAAVVETPDPLWQEVGIAFVVPRADANLDSDDLLRYLRTKLANYKIPKRLVFVGHLPELPNGKFDKVTLRQQARTLQPPLHGSGP
jgi:acyl-CoA synthetase (AMP-forming)/AMP-acid ligase II